METMQTSGTGRSPSLTTLHADIPSTVLESLSQQLNNQVQHPGVSLDIPSEDEGSTDGHNTDAPQQAPHGHSHNTTSPLAIVAPFFMKYGVFILIILLKLLYSHRHGLLIVIALIGGWYHFNNVIMQQVLLRNNKRYTETLSKSIASLIPLTLSIFSVYYFLNGDAVDKSTNMLSDRLWMSTSITGVMDLWKLLFVIVLNDYCIKYAVMIIKLLVILVPNTTLSFQRKSSIYESLERTSKLYRSLLPIIPWYYFLLQDGDGQWLSAILFVLYVVFKFLSLYEQLFPLWSSYKSLLNNTSIGVRPTPSELQLHTGGDNNCSICHEEFSSPVQLVCKHIFCEDCIAVWLDANKTCPMCRTEILKESPLYRDGSSDYMVQFF